MRQRAQAIIIGKNRLLFGYGKINSEFKHFFIGGGIEQNETPEKAVLREVEEEAGVVGKITFKFSQEILENHHTFLIDIGEEKCTLGYDPEEEGLDNSEKQLQNLVWIGLDNHGELSEIDLNYLKLLKIECEKNRFFPEWYNLLL